MHYLDLPNLRFQPTFADIQAACSELAAGTEKTDFETSDPLDRGTRQWLASLATHELSWIPETEAEALRAAASRRLSQECGVTATSTQQRKLQLSSQVTVKLDEPGMSEDLLGQLTWGSSLVLSRRLAQKSPELVRNRVVIELGAGTGLVGIAAKLVGAAEVHVTDLAAIIPNLRHNVVENHADCRVYALDWSDPQFPTEIKAPHFDVCLISDPVYSREHPPMLLDAVKLVNANKVLLQLPIRQGFAPEREFIWRGLPKLGYTLVKKEEEVGQDLFGEQQFSYTEWDRLLN